MGLIHSTLQGVPGLGCQSPAITSILFVTAANAVSLDASGAGSYNADNKSFIEDKKLPEFIVCRQFVMLLILIIF